MAHHRPSRSRGASAARTGLVVAVAIALLVAVFGVGYLVGQRNGLSSGPAPSPSPAPSSSEPTPSESPSESPSGSPSESTSGSPSESPAAQQYVVSPDGSDKNDGTAAEPWRTLEQGLESLRPGDTLTVEDGTYHERLKHLDITPGTATQPINVRAAPGSKPLLKGLLWLENADYWHLSGLNVTWSDDSGKHDHMVKFQGGKGWSMTDAEVSNARSHAAILVTDQATRWKLARLYVHSTADTNGNNQDQLIYISSTSGGGLVERCLLTDSPNGRAIKIGPPDGRSTRIGDVVIRYNTMYDNLGPSNIQLSQNSSDNRIYRNIFVRPGDDQPSITAFELEGRDNRISDNLFSNSTNEVAADADGLDVKAGNIDRDPEFVSVARNNFHPRDTIAKGYGVYAGEG